MSRQLEQQAEERSARRHQAILRAVEYEIERALHKDGYELTGLSFKIGPADCLAVVKATNGKGPQVCFVGSEDLGSALAKVVSESYRGRLRWKPDEFVG